MADTAVAEAVAAPLTGHAEMTAAFQIVRDVRISKLKWKPEVFNKVLYEDTELARAGPRRHVGENEVLMKNVYYLATRTNNISEAVVFNLVGAEVLTVDEGNSILQQPTSKLRATKMFALLVEKEDPDDSISTSVITVLHEHDNEEASIILSQHFNIPMGLVGDEQNQTVRAEQNGKNAQKGGNEEEVVAAVEPAVVVIKGAEADEENVQLENRQWACQHCTFINNTDTSICSVCFKTKGFDLDNSLEVNICPQCTMMNEHGVDFCEACGFAFLDQRPLINNRYVSDTDTSDED